MISKHWSSNISAGRKYVVFSAHFLTKKMARVTGLEPAASGVTGQRSNQLSYTRQDVSGSLTMAYPSVNAENDCFHNFLQAP